MPVEVECSGNDVNQEMLGAGFAYKMFSPTQGGGGAPRALRPEAAIRRPDPANLTAFGKGRPRSNEPMKQWQPNAPEQQRQPEKPWQPNAPEQQRQPEKIWQQPTAPEQQRQPEKTWQQHNVPEQQRQPEKPWQPNVPEQQRQPYAADGSMGVRRTFKMNNDNSWDESPQNTQSRYIL